MADVVGYSRLMGADEDDTIARLMQCRGVFSDRVSNAQGRIVNAPGDSILAEFTSVQNAVRCAVAIQRKLADLNANVPDDRRMFFRIGINLGDVVVEDDAIYGDGVNVAARLESLARPGGITVSGSVYDSVRNRVGLAFESSGEQSVKNIATPVRTYRVLQESGSTEFVEAHARRFTSRRNGARRPALLTLAVVAILVAGGILIVRHGKPGPVGPPADAGQPLPNGPSIAVLPLTNISGDPEQEYFGDGLTDTLITALSDLRDITVIARNSTFTYKGQAADVRDVGREFGVRHVLEGSVQKAGGRIRINVQLLDTATGAQVWAGKYDRNFADIFVVQDEITRAILAELDVVLVEGEQARSWRSSTDNPHAYELFLRGWEARQQITREDTARARRLFEQALELDPKFTAAVFGLGATHMAEAYSGWTASASDSFETAIGMARRAIELDPGFGGAYDLLGEALIMYRQENKNGIAYMRQAVALSPGSARYNWTLGVYLCNSGQAREGLEYVRRGFRLNPHPPGWFYEGYGRCYLSLGRFEESIAANRKATQILPDFIYAYVDLTAAYMELGREDEAREQAKEVLRINPGFSTETHPSVTVFMSKGTRQRYRDMLRMAGLP